MVESDSRSGSPRLLVLGAGPAQLGLLEAAQARGVWTAVVDRDPGAPGFRFADRRCILSTEDEPAIERLVGALEIDGIISPGTDWPVGVAARIARARRAAAPDLARDRGARDEQAPPARAARARRACRSRARGSSAATTSCPRSSGPVVVKAPDRQGQKGLTLVDRPGRAAGGDRDRARLRRGTGSRSSRSSSTGRR